MVERLSSRSGRHDAAALARAAEAEPALALAERAGTRADLAPHALRPAARARIAGTVVPDVHGEGIHGVPGREPAQPEAHGVGGCEPGWPATPEDRTVRGCEPGFPGARAVGGCEPGWPATPEALAAVQRRLAASAPPPWTPGAGALLAAGCFVCFSRRRGGHGAPGERGWAAAALVREGRTIVTRVAPCVAGAAYEPGRLALREGAALEAAVRALPERPHVLLVNATGRDHPLGAGLALHLGAILGVPTVGVTHRPLVATGEEPPPFRGATTPLRLNGEEVGALVRTRAGTRPLAVHAAWRTGVETAVEVVLRLCAGARTPEPLREARRAARAARTRTRRAG
jgi:deoxyribonuclease V